ncbi:MAG TPA: radical SAM protein [Smithella sp.]|nr:radical SAM protein [Smithella sp.]
MDWKLRKKYDALLEQETGYVKKNWGVGNTVCLAYPNIYRVGMANLGFQTVYKIFNEHPSFLCERLFLPASENDARCVSEAAEMVSLESQKPVTDFDILAFSVSFENDYPHIIGMLERAGIPPMAKERSEKHPLLIGGGIALTLNPEPLADFFDVFILGEAEEVLPQFCRYFEDARSRGESRRNMLVRLQKELENIYVPRLYEVRYGPEGKNESCLPLEAGLPRKVKIRPVKNLDAFPTQEVVSAPHTEMEDLFLVEVNRGCARGCRFCAASFVYRPVRFRSETVVLRSIADGLKRKKKIGLVGTAVSDHPALKNLGRRILEQNAKAGVGSLRADRIDEEMVAMLRAHGVETVALAPEAGSQRLRDLLRKGVTEDDIIRAALLLAEHDIPHLRLYFMVGLPGETEDDIDAIIALTGSVQHHVRERYRGRKKFRRITLSVNQFIPKPFTPFQWFPLADTRDAARKIKKIKNAFRGKQAVNVIHDVPKWNYIQALLTLGDRRVGEILLAVNRRRGNWTQALKEININPDFYVYRPKQSDEFLPWDILDLGISKDTLLNEWKKTLESVNAGF